MELEAIVKNIYKKTKGPQFAVLSHKAKLYYLLSGAYYDRLTSK